MSQQDAPVTRSDDTPRIDLVIDRFTADPRAICTARAATA
jgi:hypothetical protein